MESLPSKESGPAVVVALATPEDARAISDVMYQSWLDTYPDEEAGITREDIEEFYKNQFSEERLQKNRERLANRPANEYALVAKVNDAIVGVSRILKEDDRNKLQTLYVHPGFQGRGIGTALWHAAQGYFDAAKDTYLEVADYNARAISFYVHLGFQDTGKRLTDERFRMKSGAIIAEIEMRRPADEQR